MSKVTVRTLSHWPPCQHTINNLACAHLPFLLCSTHIYKTHALLLKWKCILIAHRTFIKLWWKLYGIQCTILTTFKWSSSIKCIDIVVLPSPPAACSTHFILQSPNSAPIQQLPILPAPTPGNCPSINTFFLYEFDCSQYLIWVDSHGICSFVTGLFHVAWCPQDSPTLLYLSKFPSFLRLNNNLYIHHIVFTHSSVGGQLGYFHNGFRFCE